MTKRPILITGHVARELAQHVRAYVKPGKSWSSVQGMNECNHGCKLYARKRGCITQYALIHYSGYGCALGCDAATREVPVSVRPKLAPLVAAR